MSDTAAHLVDRVFPRVPVRQWLPYALRYRLECPRCLGRMKIVAAIHSPDAIRKILDCLDLPSCAPPVAPAVSDLTAQMDSF